MPKALERKLKKEAKKKFPGNKKRQDKYVYGTLQKKTDWTPGGRKGDGELGYKTSAKFKEPLEYKDSV